jgi:ABC-type Na+ efflux pump permease subunit
MKDKNMNLVFEVAKWEFNRWFKIKEQIITILVGGLISLLIFGGSSLLKSGSDEIKIKVINGDVLSLNF